ncbi:MAG: hypothetical protein OHK0024_34530 [Thalassobaculales bacterium]
MTAGAELFDIAATASAEELHAAYCAWRGAPIFDRAGVSLPLHALYRGRRGNALCLLADGYPAGVHELAALDRAAELDRLLAAAPWSVHLLSADGWSCLHLAAFFDAVAAVAVLTGHGARGDLWSRAFEANLPLHAACAGAATSLDLLAAVAAVTPDIDAVQAGGHSPLTIARGAGKAAWVDWLAARGADPARLPPGP